MNQGMALETLNLAVVWRLPLLIVCIDNGWAITTTSDSVTGGSLVERARGFGMRAEAVNGRDVRAVHKAAARLIERARRGKGPAFLLASCPRLDGHFLGDPLIRMAKRPIAEGKAVLGSVLSSVTSRGGGGLADRAGGRWEERTVQFGNRSETVPRWTCPSLPGSEQDADFKAKTNTDKNNPFSVTLMDRETHIHSLRPPKHVLQHYLSGVF